MRGQGKNKAVIKPRWTKKTFPCDEKEEGDGEGEGDSLDSWLWWSKTYHNSKRYTKLLQRSAQSMSFPRAKNRKFRKRVKITVRPTYEYDSYICLPPMACRARVAGQRTGFTFRSRSSGSNLFAGSRIHLLRTTLILVILGTAVDRGGSFTPRKGFSQTESARRPIRYLQSLPAIIPCPATLTPLRPRGNIFCTNAIGI